MTPTAPVTAPPAPPRPSTRPDVERGPERKPAFDAVLERHTTATGRAPDQVSGEQEAADARSSRNARSEPDAPPPPDADIPAAPVVMTAAAGLAPVDPIAAPSVTVDGAVEPATDATAAPQRAAAPTDAPTSGDAAGDVGMPLSAPTTASEPAAGSASSTGSGSVPDVTPAAAVADAGASPSTPDATPIVARPAVEAPVVSTATTTAPIEPDDGSPPSDDAAADSHPTGVSDQGDADVEPGRADAPRAATSEPEVTPAPAPTRPIRLAAPAGEPTVAGIDQPPAEDLGRSLLARAELQRTTARPLEVGLTTSDLGRVRVTAVDGADGLQLQLSSDRSDGRARLGEHLQELRRDLSDGGVDIGSLEVTTQDAGADPGRPDADTRPSTAVPAASVDAPDAPMPDRPRRVPLHLDGLDLRI